MYAGGPIDLECTDLETARSLMKQLGEDLAHADHAARCLLYQQQHQIEIVARALFERRTLVEEDFWRLI
jgi:hypothetical protein